MSEYIVSVPDEQAEVFIARFGIESVTLFGFNLREEIVRCHDCKFKNESWNCASPYYNVEPDGFCAWGERREP